jgi:phosphorylcholine metabolism protein LicD
MRKLPPKWTFSMVDEDKKNQYIHDLKLFEKEMQSLRMPIYLIYGTLLGAIRDKDFISHDSDIDVAYLSKYQSIEKVIQERHNLKNYFIKHNLLRTTRNTQGLKVRYLNTNLDVWTSWIDNNVVHISPLFHIYKKKDVFPLKELQFRKEKFSVPNQSEIILDKVYRTWKEPITKNREYLK